MVVTCQKTKLYELIRMSLSHTQHNPKLIVSMTDFRVKHGQTWASWWLWKYHHQNFNIPPELQLIPKTTIPSFNPDYNYCTHNHHHTICTYYNISSIPSTSNKL